MKGRLFPSLGECSGTITTCFFIFSVFSIPVAEILSCILQNSKWVKEEEGVISYC